MQWNMETVTTAEQQEKNATESIMKILYDNNSKWF